MRAGVIQFNPVFGEPLKNLESVHRLLGTDHADLVVLPELFNTGYQFVSREEAFELAEPVPSGPTVRSLVEFSREFNVHIVAGLAERNDDAVYNSAVLTDPSGFIGAYRKTHLFFEETLWFNTGDTGFRVWDTSVGRIGIMICFDWFFPESARTLALRGAEIIAHPSNLVLPHCPEAMVTRCLENRVFSLTANRTGTEERGGKPPLTFIGTSEIVAPSGKVLVRAGREDECFGIVEIDPSAARNKKLNPYNDLLADRRGEFYGA